jgi:hypothetical protein
MKNRVFATLSSLTLFTAAAAFAESNTPMQADIPFEFHIGTMVLPAGHYELRPEIVRGVLGITCRDCKGAALILMNRVYAGKTPEFATLRFNRYDKTYFLSRVWIPEYSQGKELSKSKAELEFARNSSPVPPAPAAIALVRP